MAMIHSRQRGRVCQACLAVLVAAAVLGLSLAVPAQAQLGVPRVAVSPVPALPPPQLPPAVPHLPQVQPLPQSPNLAPLLPAAPALPPPVAPALAPTVQPPPLPTPDSLRAPAALAPGAASQAGPLQLLRERTVQALLRQHADVLEADPAGEPVRRQELVLVSPSPAVLDAAVAAGFGVLRDQPLPALGLRQIVLRPPPGMTTAVALAQLRALDPQGEADFNHVYTGSGTHPPGAAAREPRAAATAGTANAWRVGLVDGGLDAQHTALRKAQLQVWGCNGAVHPSPHGTTVAALLLGPDTRPSAEATLYAADIYCGQPASATVEALAQALAWMAAENVAVINISLVGPSNRLLERAVQAMVRRGHVLVAAVGNDGPAAPPLYPAAYPGVVGVTAVSSNWRVLPEAAQGPHVLFAARSGSDAVVRGTSFAAPRVAALLAPLLGAPDPDAAAAAVARLAKAAIDLGAPGRDPVFGWGLVGERNACQHGCK